LSQAEKLQEDILKSWKGSYELKVHIDRDPSKQAGWKFHEYELLGVCLRIELGSRDLKQSQAVLVRRDTGVKHFIPWGKLGSEVAVQLSSMQKDLFEKARLWRDERMQEVEDYVSFQKKLEELGGFFVAPWCQKASCEARVKEETKATIRCLPWGEDLQPQVDPRACMVCRDASSSVRAIFAKNY
jgi:prolyl-tRNA synthetase